MEIAEIEGMDGEEILLNSLFERKEESLVKTGVLRHKDKFRKAGISYEDI